MSFDSLKRNILNEAEAKVREIRAQTEKRLRQEEKRITKAAQEIEEKVLNDAEAAADQARSRLHQERQLQAKADVLTSKQKELANTEAAVVDAILSWDKQTATEFIRSLLTKLPETAGTIIPGEKHAEIVEEMVKSRTDWKVSGEILPQDGGLKFQDEQTEINLSVRYLVRQLFARHRTEIAKHLFN